MSAFFYSGGERVPFDPEMVAPHTAGCVLCGGTSAVIGIFAPTTAAMRAVILRLRTHAVHERSTPAIAYALCPACVAYEDATDRVEDALTAAAARVGVQ
jgi:hypothetical protein